jgi:putative ABC transport system substrate-binding protein
LIIPQSGWFLNNRAEISRLAIESGLPTMAGSRVEADAGMLMAYGTDLKAIFRRSAYLLDKILKGTRPAEIPVEQPTEFELVINLKTAKALGIAVPPTLLTRADEVIE